MTQVSARVEKTALATADRVAGDQQLSIDVLAALHAPAEAQDRYSDLIDLAALVVSVSTLGWTVYWDLRAKTNEPNTEVLARRIRVELPAGGLVTPEQRDLVIDAVVEQILAEDVATDNEDR